MRPKLLAKMSAGSLVALVSDAGTPLVSDPGYKLVAACHDAGIDVITIPGPSAVLAALSAAGLQVIGFCLLVSYQALKKQHQPHFVNLQLCQ